MIKKFFTFMMAAGVLLATSCSHDDLDTVQSGNETQVTFSLSLEKKIATRAISDGSQADKLVYAVFDENGDRISTIQKVERRYLSRHRDLDFGQGANLQDCILGSRCGLRSVYHR